MGKQILGLPLKAPAQEASKTTHILVILPHTHKRHAIPVPTRPTPRRALTSAPASTAAWLLFRRNSYEHTPSKGFIRLRTPLANRSALGPIDTSQGVGGRLLAHFGMLVLRGCAMFVAVFVLFHAVPCGAVRCRAVLYGQVLRRAVLGPCVGPCVVRASYGAESLCPHLPWSCPSVCLLKKKTVSYKTTQSKLGALHKTASLVERRDSWGHMGLQSLQCLLPASALNGILPGKPATSL
jgi:hypothetical protein